MTGLKGIGPILKAAREERGITLAEIEQTTKIRTKYLQAIEEENFELLPGAVYAKGFVNTYVRYLGIGEREDIRAILHPINQTPIVKIEETPQPEVRATQESISRAPKRRIEDKPITSKKHLIIGLSLVAVVALFVIQMIYSSWQKNDEEFVQPPVVSDTPDDVNDDDNNVSNEDEELPVQYEGLNLELQIIDVNPNATDRCWMEVSADGTVVFSGTLNESDMRTITANETIQAKFGNGGVVKLTLNGEDLGVAGDVGQVVRKSFSLDDLSQTAE